MLRWLANRTDLEDGSVAVNIQDGAFKVLFDMAPKDHTYFGGPLLQRRLAAGSAFHAYYYERPPDSYSTIVETQLDSGRDLVRLRVNDTVIEHFEASDKYLVAPTTINGEYGVWVMSRENGTWWNIIKNPKHNGVEPIVGGDWAIFYEEGILGSSWAGGIVGVHISTNKRYELLRDGDDVAFVSWDTDGKYLVIKVETCYDRPWNCAYPGTNIYWMELPRP